jgi:hypothetical protein
LIRFALACTRGHGFEGWFDSSDSFDTQSAGGNVLCPTCGSAEVSKTLMTPAVATSRRREQTVKVAALAGKEAELVAMLRKVREHLTSDADYVGDKFAEEARKIHFDEVEKRGIYGEATPDEVRALADDGIEFHPLPVLPEDHN